MIMVLLKILINASLYVDRPTNFVIIKFTVASINKNSSRTVVPNYSDTAVVRETVRQYSQSLEISSPVKYLRIYVCIINSLLVRK